MSLKIGDVVVFSDEWFSRRRLPVPPLVERTTFTVRVVGDDRVLVDFLEDGKMYHQVVFTSWLERRNSDASA